MSADISPICSPWRIDALRWAMRRTSVVGPVAAAVIDLESPRPLAAGVMDPSVAQTELLWEREEGVNLQASASALIYFSASSRCCRCGFNKSNEP